MAINATVIHTMSRDIYILHIILVCVLTGINLRDGVNSLGIRMLSDLGVIIISTGLYTCVIYFNGLHSKFRRELIC